MTETSVNFFVLSHESVSEPPPPPSRDYYSTAFVKDSENNKNSTFLLYSMSTEVL